MFASYFQDGGPIMYVILAAWIVVLAGVLDRLLYVAGRLARHPLRHVLLLAAQGKRDAAQAELESERRRAERGVARIDAVSQIATSIGLFGTVLGISRSFFSRGTDLGLAAPEVLASGLATALFTTIAGLIVFLFGQGFLIAWREWEAYCERDVLEILEGART